MFNLDIKICSQVYSVSMSIIAQYVLFVNMLMSGVISIPKPLATQNLVSARKSINMSYFTKVLFILHVKRQPCFLYLSYTNKTIFTLYRLIPYYTSTIDQKLSFRNCAL